MIDRNELAPNELLVLRLRGSQVEMGAQQGALLRALGGYEKVADFYPTMAARMIASATPHGVRRYVESAARGMLRTTARYMEGHRRRRFAEYAARTDALLAAGGIAPGLSYVLLVMDVFQNTVSLLGRIGAIQNSTLRTAAVPACSSLAVWDRASSDGSLRHARNFDFPGAGVWDHSPVVVFSEPDVGLRYGFVTTRGADVPGVTAFNEAGLTVTMHTRFHRDVRFDGSIGFDVGHEIVRRASTLDEAVAVAREVGSGSSWGFLVSSAAEHSAVVIDTSGAQIAATRPALGEDHMVCTNHFLEETLRAGEVNPSPALHTDSRARYARLNGAVHENGCLGVSELEALLGDVTNPGSVDLSEDATRLVGDCVVSPISVQSIVAEPEQRRLRVSIGRAPTGLGPFVEVPWSFDGPVGVVDVALSPLESRAHNHKGELFSAADRETIRAHVEVARLHLNGAEPRVVRGLTEGLVRRAPREPHFRFMAAIMSLTQGDFERSAEHLNVALGIEGGSSRRARLLLWQTRVQSVLGRTREAESARAELLAMTETTTLAQRRAAERERTKPVTRRTLQRVVPDFMLLDAALPGVH